MPTTPTTSSTRASTASTGSVSQELGDQLASSQSATLYVDADLNDKDAAALLLGDPPLHAEYDAVRDKWAVRKATQDEVDAAKAASTPSASSGTAGSSA